MTNTCPHCGRRLLSHASALCNWCGAAIDDVTYQAEAQRERAAYFQQQAQHDAQSLARLDGLNVDVPLHVAPIKTNTAPRFGRPLDGTLQNAHPSSADAPPSNPDTADDDTQARFEHLEV